MMSMKRIPLILGDLIVLKESSDRNAVSAVAEEKDDFSSTDILDKGSFKSS